MESTVAINDSPDLISEQQTLLSVLRVTHDRPHATTHEFGHLIGKSDQTIRKNYCLSGIAFGVVPIKVGNRLLWPVKSIAQLLIKGDAQ